MRVVRYGAMANKHFVLFNEEIASAITANGRASNQITAWEISRYTMKNYGYDSILAGDTDSSVLGDTIINTKKFGDIKISDYYDKMDGIIENTKENHFVKHVKEFKDETLGVIQEKGMHFHNVNYIMKHKVKKKMYRLTVNGNSVVMTEDHSMIVVRDGIFTEIKPKDIQSGDKVVHVQY